MNVQEQRELKEECSQYEVLDKLTKDHEIKFRELLRRLEETTNDYSSFKYRICLLVNLLMPGLGIFLYNGKIIKSLIFLILYYGIIYHGLHSDLDLGVAVIMYFVPAIVVLLISFTQITD